jgi:KaiC/GvpD/RAD55 family RecA-like ATPase
MASEDYAAFIHGKSQLDGNFGFEPIDMPSFLFPFQVAITEWAIRKGRAAIFADCGLGKTFMELVWADNVYRRTGKPVLILTPLAVASQSLKEAARFNIDAARSYKGEKTAPIVVANYERLHYFDPESFGGVVCDESSILKSFDGVRRKAITEFMRTNKYRLLGTATAAPNDYTELGTSSEALGYLGYMDMLGRFFTNRQRTTHMYHGKYQMKNNAKWRFKGHAEHPFWRWVASWAKALRKPSDLGFEDDGFILPSLTKAEHVFEASNKDPTMLFNLPAVNWQEVRAERRRTIGERCRMVADLINNTNEHAVVWCSLNDEADLLERLIPDGTQVSGRDSDDSKEDKFESFGNGNMRVLITKPKIGAWGLNWQHCNHIAYFPTDSYEQWYQAVRRCWRFGQRRPVTVDVVATNGQQRVLDNMLHKEQQASRMFDSLIMHMNSSLGVQRSIEYKNPIEVPPWLS